MTTRFRVALAGLLGSAGAGVALSLLIARGGPILARRWGLLGLIAAWFAAWAVAVVCALRLPRRLSLTLVLVAAAALRLAALAGPPALSDDVYRYAWDGQVQAAGIDPYRYQPSAPELADLRQDWLWPGPDRCRALNRPADCTRINRPAVRTIYPPVAELWFRLVHALGGRFKGSTWQVAGFATDVAVVAMLLRGLRAQGRDERLVALYALCPVGVLEVTHDAHVEGLALAFVLAALLAAHRRRDGWAGALMGAAAMVKLYPALLLPAVSRRRPVRAGLAFAAVVAGSYLPHVLAVGPKVLGYLPGYLAEEHYGSGTRFLLVGLLGLRGTPATAAAALAVAALAAVVWWRRDEPPVAARRLMGGLLLVATPVQPWYAVTLTGVATLSGAWWWFGVAAAGYPYFFGIILDSPHAVWLGRLSFVLALALVTGTAAWRRYQRVADVDRLDAATTAGGAQPGQAERDLEVGTRP